jgi:hypothetical protein
VTDDLFKDNSQDPEIDEDKDYYTELVGEGRRFRDNQALAKGKVFADHQVKLLEQKLDELRSDYAELDTNYKARAKLEELIDQLSTQQQSSSSEHQKANDVQVQQPEFDPKKVEDLIANQIKAHELSKKQEANVKFVSDKLKEQFGEKSQTVLKQQIESMGLTEDFVRDLARNHPQVLLKTLGFGAPAQQDLFQAPPRSVQRSDPFVPNTQKQRTWSYYQELKKKDPKTYYDPKTTVQMDKDSQSLGQAFFDS